MEAGDEGGAAAHGHKRSRVVRPGGGGGVREGEGEGEAASASARQAVVPWAQQHPSSRIYRVSRASGGKDRHSKVYTAKGIRDRRVRLSVSTAIQFYDLQDRLGYDQPSKAIEWLIKAASSAIDKLPSLDAAAFAQDAPAVSDDRLLEGGGGGAGDADAAQQMTRSGCSSTSETSKGSVLSLSRSESRVKARERARERSAARDKDKEAADDAGTAAAHPRAVANTSAQAASFTELLTGMAAASANGHAAVADHKQSWQPLHVPAAADYISFVQPRKAGQAMPHGFASAAPHLGNVAPIGMAPAQPFNFTGGAAAAEPHAEMTQFSFLQDHLMPVHVAAASGPAGDYNLNFSMSSGLVGVNRGTLQSNSQSHFSSHHHHQLQRLSAPLDTQNIPFLFGPAAAPATADNQFAAATAALQLWDGFRHSDMKEKGKN